MKKLLIFLMAFSLFTACNNDKGKLDKKADYREKDDYGNKDDRNNDDTRKDDNNNEDNNTDKSEYAGGWTRSEENKFVDDCADVAEKNVGRTRANQYCDCMLDKIKKMYSSYNEANLKLGRMSKDQIDRLAEDCNSNNVDNANNDPTNDNNVEKTNDDEGADYTSGGWTSNEVQKFVKPCVREAQKSGLEYLDAQSYCDCMQYKLAKMYTFAQADRLTQADLATPAMKKMIKNCLQEH